MRSESHYQFHHSVACSVIDVAVPTCVLDLLTEITWAWMCWVACCANAGILSGRKPEKMARNRLWDTSTCPAGTAYLVAAIQSPRHGYVVGA